MAEEEEARATALRRRPTTRCSSSRSGRERAYFFSFFFNSLFFSLDLLDVVFELILCSSVSPSLYSTTVEPPRDQGTGGLGLDGRDGHAEGARLRRRHWVRF